MTPEQIIQIVSEEFQVKPTNIHSYSRKREYVFARMACSYLIKRHKVSYSLSTIGKIVAGGRRSYYDHSTVIHHIQQTQNMIDTDERYRALIENCMSRITKYPEFTAMRHRPK